jgi:hypothetical protein
MTGRSGSPTELILHPNGRDLSMKRLDDAQAQQVVDAAALAKRIKEQTPARAARRRYGR